MLQYLRIQRLKLVFIGEYIAFRKLSKKKRPNFLPLWENRYPCLHDKTATTGYDRHYLLHTAWAARKIAQTHPERHTDISSSLYFCSLVSAFVPIDFYDYRPAMLHLEGLQSRAANLLALPFQDGSIKSLSCMHVVEHVGLGRYGDPLNPEGDLKAISELKRVMAKGGNLFFVVPLGQSRIMFNAHRIYSYDQILECFSDLTLMEFSLITDSEHEGGLAINASKTLADVQSYGCGCFWFKK